MSTETAGEGREGAAATTAEERDGAAAEEYTLQWATRLFRYLESGEKGDPPSPVTPVEVHSLAFYLPMKKMNPY